MCAHQRGEHLHWLNGLPEKERPGEMRYEVGVGFLDLDKEDFSSDKWKKWIIRYLQFDIAQFDPSHKDYSELEYNGYIADAIEKGWIDSSGLLLRAGAEEILRRKDSEDDRVFNKAMTAPKKREKRPSPGDEIKLLLRKKGLDAKVTVEKRGSCYTVLMYGPRIGGNGRPNILHKFIIYAGDDIEDKIETAINTLNHGRN